MDSPLIPPDWFVARINEQRDGPPLTALDPLMMLLWHQVAFQLPQPMCIVTGI